MSSKVSHKLFKQYQHLAPTTLYKLFGQPHSVARSKLMEYDDLLQYAHEGLWKACVSYDECQSNFETYAINNIRWSVLDGTNRESSTFQYNPNDMPKDEDKYSLVGYDTPINHSSDGTDDTMTVADTIPNNKSVEEECVYRLMLDEILKPLNDREKKVVLHKVEGLPNNVIADKLNVSPQAISKALLNVRGKLNNKKKELVQCQRQM